MKEGWNIKQIGEIGKVSMCKRIYKKQTSPIGEIPFYKIGTFGKSPDAYISKELYNQYREKYSYPKRGEILLSASGTIGRPVVFDGNPSYFQDSNIVWISHDESEVLNEYLLKFYRFCDWNPSKGATISRLYNDDLRRIKIPIPPLAEQKQIVSILDKVFAAIDKAKANIEKNIQNAEGVFQSKLNEVFSSDYFTDTECKLIDACVLQRGFDLPKRLREPGEYPLASSSGIIDTHIESRVKGPGVVTGRSGSIGNVFYVEKDFWPLNTVLYIKDFKGNVEKYIYYLLKNFRLEKYSSGAGVPTLNRNFVHDKLVRIASDRKRQKQLVFMLDKVYNLVSSSTSIYMKKLSEIEELKSSVLQKAFNGELTSDKVIEQIEATA